jgi:hypothetical protein
MTEVQIAPLPAGALLEAYARAGTYTDCFCVRVERQVTLADFMSAFYTTPVFKLERWLLARGGMPSSDAEAVALAEGRLDRFAAWTVEAREPMQAVLAAGRTRSWLTARPDSDAPTRTLLYFGSAVVPRRRGGMGWPFRALLGFHKLYSRILLGAAARRLERAPRGPTATVPMSVSDLRAWLEASRAPGLRGAATVWRLDGKHQEADDLRVALLALVLRFPSVFLHYDGDPPEEPSLEASSRVAPNVWRLPPAASGRELGAWLSMGNWQLYARGEPLQVLPDLCRADDEAVRDFVRRSAVAFVIDSFHDNVEWTLGLHPAAA